ncbi:MAG: hypothetical protein K2Y05_02135 [Hyphomicrobiaceae bacterium]|nr:hypothetical protein [Hyphomicrobiaceae bacterium]
MSKFGSGSSPQEPNQRPRTSGGFGKRGRVELSPRPTGSDQRNASSEPDTPSPASSSIPTWALGLGAAAMFAVLVFGTGGGGGLLGGLLGGLIAGKIASNAVGGTKTATAANTSAPRPAAPADSVSRSGFGNTGSSGGWFSGG